MKCKHCGKQMLRTEDSLYWACPYWCGKLIPIPPAQRKDPEPTLDSESSRHDAH